MREIKLYLLDIKDSIRKINKYTENITYDEFVKNEEKIDAVLMNFQTIGEAVKKLDRIYEIA